MVFERFELEAHNYKINTLRWHCIIMIWVFVSIPLSKYGYSVTYFYKILLWYVKSTFDISRNTKRLFLSFCQLSRNIISFPHSSAPRISNFKYLFKGQIISEWSHRFSQNTNEKLSGFLPCVVRAEIFRSYFGRNDDFINSFWN